MLDSLLFASLYPNELQFSLWSFTYEDNYYMTNTSPTCHCFDTLKFMEIP